MLGNKGEGGVQWEERQNVEVLLLQLLFIATVHIYSAWWLHTRPQSGEVTVLQSTILC